LLVPTHTQTDNTYTHSETDLIDFTTLHLHAVTYAQTDSTWTHTTHTHTLTDLKRLFADFGSNAAAASAATGLC